MGLQTKPSRDTWTLRVASSPRTQCSEQSLEQALERGGKAFVFFVFFFSKQKQKLISPPQSLTPHQLKEGLLLPPENQKKRGGGGGTQNSTRYFFNSEDSPSGFVFTFTNPFCPLSNTEGGECNWFFCLIDDKLQAQRGSGTCPW